MRRQNNSLRGANQLQLKAIQKFAMQWSSTHYKEIARISRTRGRRIGTLGWRGFNPPGCTLKTVFPNLILFKQMPNFKLVEIFCIVIVFLKIETSFKWVPFGWLKSFGLLEKNGVGFAVQWWRHLAPAVIDVAAAVAAAVANDAKSILPENAIKYLIGRYHFRLTCWVVLKWL